ncbi:Uma2 family endonuclease [Streptomyces sp. SID8374]|uniref:Uma2 family endonuclease n=1 Tax=Streptomyces sp. SID8374 TaxID=2690354 RepID=UPI001370B2B8|nr:Uma2 family endonuclease [Streptomyces sp. SID8374]MYX15095.1 Uma2 family endonuclease [Streptomyces sp. SID8374]
MGETMAAEELPDHSLYRQPDGSSRPVPPPAGYTVEDFFTLDLPPHTELIDGSPVLVSPQRKFHTLAMYLLEQGLRQHVPNGLRVRREMAVVLSKRNAPEPDLLVVTAAADGDQRTTRYQAADVLLAVEVVSPESEDRDRGTKPHKYAAAGIKHFWLVEMTGERDRPMVITYELDPVNKTYVSTGVHHDRLKLSAPYDIDIDLTAIDEL